MKKLMFTFVLFVLLVALFPLISSASWLIYHKPAFRGKVIDAGTKTPIAGAVVVATYYKSTMGVPHHYSSIINVKEALTDQNGEFAIPSYTTFIQPLSVSFYVSFIIFKPGYGNFPEQHVSPQKVGVRPEDFFSGDYGKEGELIWLNKKIKVTFGIVELQKLQTRDERLRSIPSIPFDEFLDRIPSFIRLINEEEKNLGLEKTDPFKTLETLKKMED
jgi:hypothetical protein